MAGPVLADGLTVAEGEHLRLLLADIPFVDDFIARIDADLASARSGVGEGGDHVPLAVVPDLTPAPPPCSR